MDTVKSMENKSTSAQLPTALRLGNTLGNQRITSSKSDIIDVYREESARELNPVAPPEVRTTGPPI